MFQTLLTGCQKTTRGVNPQYVTEPFAFSYEGAEWLKACELQIETSDEVVDDFDRLRRKYEKDKFYYDFVNERLQSDQ